LIQDYLFKMLADRRTRLFVTLVLLAMLAYQLSISFWQFYASPNLAASDYRSQVIVANNSARPEQSYLEKAQIISRAYLFGKPAAAVSRAQVTEAPKTRLNYKLRGIYYSTVGRLASAIVEIKANHSQYYRLDDELAENITVAAIERDHILINRYGKIERLNLEKPIISRTGQPANNRNTNTASSANSTALLRSYKKRYASNPMALATRFQAIPVSKNGQNIGFRLKALRGESLLKKLKFQDSDVFTQVNGIGLNKPFQALDALRALTTASDVSVTVLRNGVEETVNFSL
jgi:type II secretion system protein C